MDMTSKSGWDTIKDSYKNKCVICNKSEKKVGELERVHIKEHARVRYLVLPMCANHHKMYIKNQLSSKSLFLSFGSIKVFKNLIFRRLFKKVQVKYAQTLWSES